MLGQVGVFIARYLYTLIGISAWIVPWILALITWQCFAPQSTSRNLIKVIPLLTGIVSICVIGDLKDLENPANLPAIQILQFNQVLIMVQGEFLVRGCFLASSSPNTKMPEDYGYLKIWLGIGGSWIFAVLLLLFSFVFYFSIGMSHFQKLAILLASRTKKDGKREEEAPKPKLTFEIEKESEKNSDRLSLPIFSLIKDFFSKEQIHDDSLFGDVSQSEEQVKKIVPAQKAAPKTKKNEDSNLRDETSSGSTKESVSVEKALVVKKEQTESPIEAIPPNSLDGFKVVRAEKTEKATDLFPERKGDYHFPTLELLMEPPEEISNGDEDHMEKARRLKETLSEFKIEVELGEVHTGPVITRYDIHPAAGVRVEKIANLDKNLAMSYALKASGF